MEPCVHNMNRIRKERDLTIELKLFSKRLLSTTEYQYTNHSVGAFLRIGSRRAHVVVVNMLRNNAQTNTSALFNLTLWRVKLATHMFANVIFQKTNGYNRYYIQFLVLFSGQFLGICICNEKLMAFFNLCQFLCQKRDISFASRSWNERILKGGWSIGAVVSCLSISCSGDIFHQIN